MNGWMDVGAESGVVQVPTAVSYMENGIFFCLDMICLAFFFVFLFSRPFPLNPQTPTPIFPPLSFPNPPLACPRKRTLHNAGKSCARHFLPRLGAWRNTGRWGGELLVDVDEII